MLHKLNSSGKNIKKMMEIYIIERKIIEKMISEEMI
jgi:hypothetical protein